MSEFQTLTNYKQGFSLLKTITIVSIGIGIIIPAITYIYAMNILDKHKSIVYVMDTSGAISYAQIADIKETRIYEYDDAVRTAYTLWYQFDENSYQTNIDKALELFGECGKDLKHDYDYEKMLIKLRERNLIMRVEIIDLVIDMKTEPISGTIIGIQRIAQGSNEIKRNMNATFKILDCDRGYKNPHGVKIEEFKAYDDSVIEPEKK